MTVGNEFDDSCNLCATIDDHMTTFLFVYTQHSCDCAEAKQTCMLRPNERPSVRVWAADHAWTPDQRQIVAWPELVRRVTSQQRRFVFSTTHLLHYNYD